ncbi:PDZK1-interacting protein 1 [Denticeps clupeoides]|uniref:PDZK1-interacting protein 1 n=1 Tax=Denticeps clupeoides TaxID=299321 RepID=A0AAY4AXS8_9TELE|nr:PDZK1-interacting protein 1 [Denticeps clupeoides]
MGKVTIALSQIVLILGLAAAQAGTTEVERALPSWLMGIIAVVVFLFLVFVAFLANKAWCEEPSHETKAGSPEACDYAMTNGSTYDGAMEAVRSRDHRDAYENVAAYAVEDATTVM